jgi:hypothetical protein
MQHLEEGEIHAWLDGALSEAERARIEQHAATCKECAAMVADARGLIAGAARIVSALDHVPSGVIPKSGTAAAASRPLWRALRLTPFRAAMAASLIVAAGSLIVVQRKDGALMVPSADKVAIPVAASATAAAPPAPAPLAENKVKRVDAPTTANEARQLEQARSRSPEQSVSKTTLALQDTALLMKPAAPIAAPAPKVASAEDQSAKKERDSALSSVVVPAAPASAAGAGGRGGQQGQSGQAQRQAGQRQPIVLDSVRTTADIAFRRALPPAVQRAEGSANFASVAPSFVGCYQVVDSVAWQRSLPVWFAIAPDSARVHLVRPGVEQRPVIGRWQNVSPTSIAITLDGSNTASFTLTQTGTEIVATTPNAPTVRLRVLRPSCAF